MMLYILFQCPLISLKTKQIFKFLGSLELFFLALSHFLKTNPQQCVKNGKLFVATKLFFKVRNFFENLFFNIKA